MRFRIWMQEPYDAWCKLQKPGVANACNHDWRSDTEGCYDENHEPVDCRLPVLCSFCRCNSTGCHAMQSDTPRFASNDGSYARFDITLDGDRADGSVQGLVPDISISIGGPVERLRLFAGK